MLFKNRKIRMLEAELRRNKETIRVLKETLKYSPFVDGNIVYVRSSAGDYLAYRMTYFGRAKFH